MSEEAAEYRVENRNPKTNNTRNKFASHGLEILKWAVLDVLYHSEYGIYRQALLTAGDIRERLGISRPKIITGSTNALIHGVLQHLHDEGYVEHHVSSGWLITEKGVSVIESGEICL